VVVNGTVYIGTRPFGAEPNGWMFAFDLDGPPEEFTARTLKKTPAGPPDPASLVPDYTLTPQ
jgi:hypothetical protein